MSDRNLKKPELLCPAGSEPALDAAIEGGADAVYLGGTAMNARMHAGNFAPDVLRNAVRKAHAYGVKVYLTLNTLVTDRELSAFADAARDAMRAGVDSLIVADIGGAVMLHRLFPEFELHASTQMSGHNSMMGAELKKLGFSRMVAAREISAENLRRLVQDSPIETELFIHGALCVSHSGQCLFSSLVGGRSGNRGECAQPCRLPYGCRDCRRGGEQYPLSLKDLSLAAWVPDLIRIGVASLKIEGRMKSPEYVYETSRIWRRLLDEDRAASPQEMKILADAFSRAGFTDGYYTGRIGHAMLGVRRETDKQNSKGVEQFAGLRRKAPVSVRAIFKAEEPASLTLSDGKNIVCVTGAAPQIARTSPMTAEDVLRSLCKFGNTPFCAETADAEVGEGLMMPVSQLNDLRRRAVEELQNAQALPERREEPDIRSAYPEKSGISCLSARFVEEKQITPAAKRYFERIYLPLHKYNPVANGVVLPPVIFDGDAGRVRVMLKNAKSQGAVYALVGNFGHLGLVRESGLIPVGDFRLNLTNCESVALCEAMGFERVILSPELTIPQMRDIGGNISVIVYGRIPLMTLEKCVVKELADCNACAAGKVRLTDRRGMTFPVLREWEHRNVVYNSIPTGMSDQVNRLTSAGLRCYHFLFSDETPEQVDAVIAAYQNEQSLPFPVRRV